MGLRINTNTPALEAQRQAGQTTRRLLQGFERLSSGLRINRAADDAAGLAIAERFRAEVRQFTQEANNIQYGVNAARTAEGALAQQQEGVARLEELAVQAANGTLTAEQRGAINQEAQQIIEQINNIGTQTEFNGQNLLNGAATGIQLGVEGGGLQLNVGASTAATLGVNTVNLGTQAGATQALETLNTAAQRISQNRASLGAQENRFMMAIEQRQTSILNNQEAESRIRDLDIARQVMEQNRNNVMQQTGIAALAQANLQNQNATRLLGA